MPQPKRMSTSPSGAVQLVKFEPSLFLWVAVVKSTLRTWIAFICS